ncbi:MAG TPA: toll/interleukin-1 receptor domain-containing protein [Isosphaeraceae bacterium]|jgi:hypothetical protein|nr:toll/interleukin-1 receptor domain-containing protein [Isosphaeraceae bacterium]
MADHQHKHQVFISYSYVDSDWAGRLAAALAERNIVVWFAGDEIKPGEPFLDRMEEGLRQSAYVVPIISRHSARSSNMAAELGAALALRKLLIPVVEEDAPRDEIPGPIRLRRYLVQREPEQVADEIASVVASAPTA